MSATVESVAAASNNRNLLVGVQCWHCRFKVGLGELQNARYAARFSSKNPNAGSSGGNGAPKNIRRWSAGNKPTRTASGSTRGTSQRSTRFRLPAPRMARPAILKAVNGFHILNAQLLNASQRGFRD
jgi:hypothetical protein